tara:strand:- start:1276 stop:1950 length:675 start_codon:yes stop_codon:yes gene_type:complete
MNPQGADNNLPRPQPQQRQQTEEERLAEVRRQVNRMQMRRIEAARKARDEALRKEGSSGRGLGGGKRKSKRRKSKRKKSKRKKRRKKKTKKRRRRKRQRGGMGQYNCVYPSNVGEIFTGIKLNKNPVLPDPINSNTNVRASHKQKGGGFMDNWGMGDALLGWYKGTNAVSNIPIRYKGGKPLMNANPMHQPGLLKEEHIHKTANIPVMYRSASDKAVDAKFTVN